MILIEAKAHDNQIELQH